MKVDKTTILLATLALASIGVAERAFGQPTTVGSGVSIGSDVQSLRTHPSQ
jgi:hypothetical protein